MFIYRHRTYNSLSVTHIDIKKGDKQLHVWHFAIETLQSKPTTKYLNFKLI